MQLGTGSRPVISTLAVAMLLGIGATAPATAATGGAGLSLSPPKTPMAAPAKPATPTVTLAPVSGIPQIEAGVAFRKVSRRATSAATLRYVSHASQPLKIRVDVVRLLDGLSIFHDERTVAPEATRTIRWSGRADNGVALDGRYEFRIALADVATSSTDGGAPATTGGAGTAGPLGSPPPPGAASVGRFNFVGAVFPVLGEYDFGSGSGRFGAGRSGHSHQGQDVMADCGVPLVAARGGVVLTRARHSAAGNYLVIRDAVSGQDFMYAHLSAPAIVRKGDRVETGQPIGIVGDTGHASACHLHFEIWSAPGWYAGGQPIDPLPTLEGWDKRG